MDFQPTKVFRSFRVFDGEPGFRRLLGAGVEFRSESTLGPFQDDLVGKPPVMGPSHGMSMPAFTAVDGIEE